jgi:tetratricopeptide (TPR) repeat protein
MAVRLNPALKGKAGSMLLPQIGTRIDSDPALNKIEHSPIKDDGGFAPESSHGRSQSKLARLNNTAARLINERQFEEAIKTLNDVILANPDYAQARENLTIAHNNWGLELAKRSPSEAATQFRQAIYLDPSQGASRRNLDAMIRETGKNPKEADDRLAMAMECQSAGDFNGAFIEASEAARLKNTPAVRAALKKALLSLDARESREARLRSEAAEAAENKSDSQDDKLSRQEATVLGQLKPMVNISSMGEAQNSSRDKSEPSSDRQPQEVIDQARELAQNGRTNQATDMLEKLISHIKSRAAIDESSGFDTLDLALDTLIDMYVKLGKYESAEINLNELVMLRESARDHSDPILGNTYRQYAKVLTTLHRSHEAKIYEDKADAISQSKEAKQ